MQHDHEPDPTFVEHLEWQIRSALRRRGRFARPVPGTAARAVRTALIVLLSLLGGAGAVVAAERIQDAREKVVVLRRTQLELEMATTRLDFARRELLQVRALAERGVATEDTVLSSEAELAAVEREVRTLRLVLEEVELSGQPARRDLSAPLVLGRDFVSEHLQIELQGMQRGVDLARVRLDYAQKLADQGVVSSTELRGERADLARAEAQVDGVLRRTDLRGAFLRGERSAEQVALLEHQMALELDRRMARTELERVAESLDQARKLQERGMLAGGEVARMELELRMIEGQIELIELELALVLEKLGR